MEQGSFNQIAGAAHMDEENSMGGIEAEDLEVAVLRYDTGETVTAPQGGGFVIHG